MMNVPRSVIRGKSPMKTVWLLISPVLVFMNSAVTNSGASYVWSRSLHDSMDLRVSSKRWSRKDSDIDPEKSSIGEISSKISSKSGAVRHVRAARRQGVGDPPLPALVAEQPVEASPSAGPAGLAPRAVHGFLRRTDDPQPSVPKGGSGTRCARQPTRVLPQTCYSWLLHRVTQRDPIRRRAWRRISTKRSREGPGRRVSSARSNATPTKACLSNRDKTRRRTEPARRSTQPRSMLEE